MRPVPYVTAWSLSPKGNRMSRSVLSTLSLRSALVASGTALLVVLPSLPAFAATPPSPASALSVTVGDRFADLTWTDGDGAGAIVRDVTGVAAPYTPTSGRSVTASSASTAQDTGFRNVGTTTYAIWSTASDGTPSDTPLVQDVAAAALVPTTLALDVSHTVGAYGLPVTVTGSLTRPGSVPVANQRVDLYGRYGGTTANVLLRHLTSASDGGVHATLLPSRTLALTLSFAGDAFSAASTSVARNVRLVPRISARLNPPAIVRSETSVLSGAVAPQYGGARVVLQRWTSKGWSSIAATKTNVRGAYSFRLSPAVGVYRHRAVLAGTAAWVMAGSAPVVLRVDTRDLASGLRGNDVLALQRRLAALHYLVGAQDGVFGYNLTHAVMTFQKVEHLPVTGRWTKAERVRAGHPTAWRLRYRTAGLAAEVDITRQVLVLSKAGVVQRIVDVSSGSERVYYQSGQRNIAHTPRGRYAITWRINGMHESELGLLYRPVFFFQGYAIHGSGSVPAYPASHGCVRVTNPVMDMLFPILVKGVPVSVYDE
ncbi:MAG: hypothetical protein JWM02_1865 [Frankiales bacterium]|nr:hypothetical protein [Frankiales bacterium]